MCLMFDVVIIIFTWNGQYLLIEYVNFRLVKKREEKKVRDHWQLKPATWVRFPATPAFFPSLITKPGILKTSSSISPPQTCVCFKLTCRYWEYSCHCMNTVFTWGEATATINFRRAKLRHLFKGWLQFLFCSSSCAATVRGWLLKVTGMPLYE